MKKYYYVPCLLASVCVFLSSCLKSDEEEIELSDEAAITAFTLGNLTQTDPSSGNKTTLSGSLYKMGIDQINFRIYNRDSLPIGTDISSVAATVTTKNSGYLSIRSLSDTTMFDMFSSSENYSFNTPRIFRVYATDASYYRDYKVTLNVKKAKGTSFWTSRGDTTLLGGFSNMRMLAIDTTLIILGSNGSATQLCISLNKGKNWQEQSQEFDGDAWKNAVVSGDSLFVLSNNQLYYTKDLKQWNSLANSWNLKQLVASDSKELFALTADSLLKSAMAGVPDVWKEELIDNSQTIQDIKKQLAVEAIASTSFPYTAMLKTDYVLMMGNNGTRTVAWRKISQYGNPDNTGKWVSIPYQDNAYRLPKQSRLALLRMGTVILAVGDNTPVYQSTDQGITWRINTTYTLPIAMQAATIDGQGILWGVSVNSGKGTVWQGSSY